MLSYYRKKRRKAAGPIANLVEDAIANVMKRVRFDARMKRQIRLQLTTTFQSSLPTKTMTRNRRLWAAGVVAARVGVCGCMTIP